MQLLWSRCAQFTCVAGTKVQILTLREHSAAVEQVRSVYLRCWYNSTNTDAVEQFKDQRSTETAAVESEMAALGSQFTCFSGTKVQILTQTAVLVQECERVKRVLDEKDNEIVNRGISSVEFSAFVPLKQVN
jgi:hypothetical protein